MITLLGSGFGPNTGSVVSATTAIPTQLVGVRVLFDGIPAPLLYVQSQQINAIMPWEIAGRSSTQVQVQFGGASTNSSTIQVVPAAPALFNAGYTSSQGAIINSDGTLNFSANPAAPGSVVALWGTGGGAMSPAGATGQLWPLAPLSQMTLQVTATIGGAPAKVMYAGAAPGLVSGFFQINLQIPPNASSGNAYIGTLIGGVPQSYITTVAIK